MTPKFAERLCVIEDRVFTSRRLAVYSAALAVVYIAFLAFGIAEGLWVETRAGVPVVSDFLPMWVAGRQVIEHGAPSAYDWPTMLAAEHELTEGAFTGFYPWPYPPTFFFAAIPVAMLPYAAAFAVWMGSIMVTYLVAIYAIVPRWVTPLVALASPTAFWGVAIGQNSMLTATLLGGSLAFIETRPVNAGILLGLLTYKPQFGLLFPLVLLLTGNWRAIVAAAATALALAGASWLAFGAASWEQFGTNLAHWGDFTLNTNTTGWAKLQSVYGLLRSLGVGAAVAWVAHTAVALATAAVVAAAWIRRLPQALKAALLSVGALIVTPYVFFYDLAILGVPIAFLVKEGLSSGFLRGERSAMTLLAAVPLLMLPLGPSLPFSEANGLVMILVTAALVIMRIVHSERCSLSRAESA